MSSLINAADNNLIEGDNIVSLTNNKIDILYLSKLVSDPGAGAICSFTGVTRDNFEDKEVVSLSYEAYEDMALSEMINVCHKTREKWGDISKIAIQHKLGDCPVSDISVYITVSSPHRKAALEAVHFAIDELKATVPIWKKEFYSDDTNNWKKNKESPMPILASGEGI